MNQLAILVGHQQRLNLVWGVVQGYIEERSLETSRTLPMSDTKPLIAICNNSCARTKPSPVHFPKVRSTEQATQRSFSQLAHSYGPLRRLTCCLRQNQAGNVLHSTYSHPYVRRDN